MGLETWGRHKAKTTTLLIEGKRLPPGARRGLGRGQRYYKIAPGIYAERARDGRHCRATINCDYTGLHMC